MEWMAQGVAQRVIDLVVDSLDVNALIARIDLNAVLARVDLNVALGRVDVNQELGRVDLNQVLGRVDLNQELARVDLNQVIDRVDLNQVIDRVDINEIAGRIDIEALVKNTDLGALLASSSSTLATETIDLGRSHAVSMDDTLARWVSRLRRNHTGRAGPPELLNAQEEHAAPADVGLPEPMPHDGGTPLPAPLPLSVPQNLRGHYAGFASRFIAFVFDCVLSIAVFELALAAISFAASVLTGTSIHWNRGNLWVVIAFFAWEFLYYAYSWTVSGKTPGMMILGVQVVGQDGSHAGTKRGLVRTLAFPLSFLLLGLGFLGILLGRGRRALHDVIAGTAVVYDWDAREARLRSLARERNARRPESPPVIGPHP